MIVKVSPGKSFSLLSIPVASTYLPFLCSWGFTKMCLLTQTNMPHMRRTGCAFQSPPVLPVRQYRLLPFGFLQCLGHPKPPCHLLILLSVTSVYKGLYEYEYLFIKVFVNFVSPSGKIHSLEILLSTRKFVFSKFFKSLQRVRAAYAGRTQQLHRKSGFGALLTGK